MFALKSCSIEGAWLFYFKIKEQELNRVCISRVKKVGGLIAELRMWRNIIKKNAFGNFPKGVSNQLCKHSVIRRQNINDILYPYLSLSVIVHV